jgi:hypothetical protein
MVLKLLVHSIQAPDMAASPRKFYSFAHIFTHRHLKHPEQSYLGWSDSGRTASHPLQAVSKQYADIFLLCQFGTQKGGHGSYSHIPQLITCQLSGTGLSTGFGNQRRNLA